MPQGPGTYGSKVGRPAKKKYKKGGMTKKARSEVRKFEYGEVVTETPEGPAATPLTSATFEDNPEIKKGSKMSLSIKKPSRWGSRLGRKFKKELFGSKYRSAHGSGKIANEKNRTMARMDEQPLVTDTTTPMPSENELNPMMAEQVAMVKKGGKVKKYLKGGGLKVGDVTDRGEVVSINPKSGNVKYKEGTDKKSRAATAKRAKYTEGEAGDKQMNIDDLAAERNKYEKGSAEYVAAQNEINKLMGVEKRHAEPKKETFKERRARKKAEKSERRKGKLAKRRGYSDADMERVASYAGKNWAMDDTINKAALEAYQSQQKEANKPKSEFVKEGFKLKHGGQVGESSGGGLYNWPSSDARKR
tara:strand:+ start:1206 stop:2285 length:1080 start_codon:yes stop_codon:yes gene_type:complete